jgi:Lar family restriction alleviation protein
MTKNLVELKPLPCPFCGFDDCEIRHIEEDEYYVLCSACESSGSVHSNEKGCIEAWNRRNCD